MRGAGRTLAGLALALAAASVVVPAGPAHAQEVCTNRVYEDTARLEQYRQPIEQLAATVNTALGADVYADVYVRVLLRVPGADLDAWQAGMQAQCANWRDEVGLRKATLVVLAVAVDDRKTGLYYGADFAPALDQEWERIQTTYMNPFFQQGAIGAGVANGLSGIATVLTEHAAAAPQPTPVPDARRAPYQDEPSFEPGPAWFEEEDPAGRAWGPIMALAAIGGVVALVMKVMGAGGSGLGGPRRRRSSAWDGDDSLIRGHVPRPPVDAGPSWSSGDSWSSPSSSSGSGGSSGSAGGGGGSTSW